MFDLIIFDFSGYVVVLLFKQNMKFVKLAGRWPTAIFQLAPAPFPLQLLQYDMDFGANIQPGPTVQNTTTMHKTCSYLFC